MNADSPAATSCGSGRSSGCGASLMRGEHGTPRVLTDVVVLERALERVLRDQRPDRRVELRERAVERAVIDVAAHAAIARRHRLALGRRGAEHVEFVLLLALARAQHVDLEVRELGLREAVLVDGARLR